MCLPVQGVNNAKLPIVLLCAAGVYTVRWERRASVYLLPLVKEKTLSAVLYIYVLDKHENFVVHLCLISEYLMHHEAAYLFFFFPIFLP